MSDFTRGEGGFSAESDMSDFWPDFFLQTAPKRLDEIIVVFRTWAPGMRTCSQAFTCVLVHSPDELGEH